MLLVALVAAGWQHVPALGPREPTGGYLLSACLATGHAAGRGAAAWALATLRA